MELVVVACSLCYGMKASHRTAESTVSARQQSYSYLNNWTSEEGAFQDARGDQCATSSAGRPISTLSYPKEGAVQDARGDQCDACGKLLECTALLHPRCKLTGTTPVLRATTHLFLDLPALSPQLQAYIDRSSRAGGWSSNCVQVALGARAAPVPHTHADA